MAIRCTGAGAPQLPSLIGSMGTATAPALAKTCAQRDLARLISSWDQSCRVGTAAPAAFASMSVLGHDGSGLSAATGGLELLAAGARAGRSAAFGAASCSGVERADGPSASAAHADGTTVSAVAMAAANSARCLPNESPDCRFAAPAFDPPLDNDPNRAVAKR